VEHLHTKRGGRCGAGVDGAAGGARNRRAVDEDGGSSIVVIDGLSKPLRTAAKAKDYSRILNYRTEFQNRRTVLGSA
jgi:hypothetical protein